MNPVSQKYFFHTLALYLMEVLTMSHRWCCRRVHCKISVHVDEGKNDTGKLEQTGSEDPHRRERKFPLFCLVTC